MKIALTLFLYITVSFGLSAQFINEVPENISGNVSKERLWFSFGLGPRIHQTTPGRINTYLDSKTDFTNYTNRFEGVKRIYNSIILIGGQAKINYTHPIGLNHGILLDIAFGDNRAYFGGYSLGWEIPLIRKKNRLHVQPGLAFLLGYTQHLIGEIGTTDFLDFEANLIQIGNTQYFGTRLKMFMTQDKVSYVYGPELAFNFMGSQSNVGFQLSAGYYFGGAQSDAIVIFDPVDRNQDFLSRGQDFRKTSSLSVNNSELNIFYNENIPIQKSLFDYGGLRGTASITVDF